MIPPLFLVSRLLTRPAVRGLSTRANPSPGGRRLYDRLVEESGRVSLLRDFADKCVNVIDNGVIRVIRLKQKMTVPIVCDLHVKSFHTHLRPKKRIRLEM